MVRIIISEDNLPYIYSLKYDNKFSKKIKSLQPTESEKLKIGLDCLAKGKELPENLKDHNLKGNLSHLREFHIAGDKLVLYETPLNEIMQIKILCITNHGDLVGKPKKFQSDLEYLFNFIER